MANIVGKGNRKIKFVKAVSWLIDLNTVMNHKFNEL